MNATWRIGICALVLYACGCSSSKTTTNTRTESITIDTTLAVTPSEIETEIPIAPDEGAALITVPEEFSGEVTNVQGAQKVRVKINLRKRTAEVEAQPETTRMHVELQAVKTVENSTTVSRPWYSVLWEYAMWLVFGLVLIGAVWMFIKKRFLT